MEVLRRKHSFSVFIVLTFSSVNLVCQRGHAATLPCNRKDNVEIQEFLDGSRWGKCPSLQTLLVSMPAADCTVCTCQDDHQCDIGYKCCNNGCVNTCVVVAHQAPVIDWLEEPIWEPELGDALDPNRNIPVETCSTSNIEDEDQLKCPTGFVCLLEDAGDKTNDIPNRGVCVQD